jgi:ABC-type glycerol-3-phosphate transport system substrate-binding protein
LRTSSRRSFLILASGALAGLSLAACGGSAATTVTTSAASSAAPASSAATSSAAPATSAATTSAASTSAATSSAAATTASAATSSTAAATTSAAATSAASSSSAAAASASKAPTPVATPVPVTLRGTKVTFWHTQSGPNAQLLNQMVLAYNATQSNYTIVPEYKGSYDDLYKANLAAINAGQPVPLSVAYENQVADYYTSKLVVPWDDYINNAQYGLSAADKADFFPAFLELGKFSQFGNKFLTFPFGKSLELMWYNADLLKKAGYDKPPATWDDFQQQALKLGTGGQKAWEFSADASRFATWVFSRHADLLSADGQKLTINTPEAQASMGLLAALVQAKVVQTPTGFQAETDFEQQKTAFYQDSSSARSYILADLTKANVNFNWTAEMPPVGQSGQDPASDLYGGNVTLFKTSSEAQLGAWEFMKYFSAGPQTAKWALGTGYMPVRKSATTTEEYKAFLAQNPRNAVAINGLQYAGNKGEPKVAAWQQVRDILLSMMQQVVAGTANYKDALAAADQNANAALKTS